MSERLDDSEFDFDDVDTQLEEEGEGFLGRARKNAEEVYEFSKEAVGKSGAVGVPVGAGAAALLNQPVELGAGAGLSASLVYDIAKEQMTSDYDFNADDAAFATGLTSLPALGGLAASKRDEIVEYVSDATGKVADAGLSAYDSVANAGAEAANYAMTQGPQVANDVAAASDEAALGVGAGLASLVGGTYAMGKAYDKLSDDEEFENEFEDEYGEDDW